MPQLALRPARPEECALLGPIERAADARYREAGMESFPEGDVIPLDVAEGAIGEGRIIVAVMDGDLVGWLYRGRVGEELSLGQVSVLPSHGRLGVGTALLRSLIDWASSAGEATIVLNTQADVAWNMPWYARHGFEVVPEPAWTPGMRAVTEAQRAHGIDWSARVHMRLRLIV